MNGSDRVHAALECWKAFCAKNFCARRSMISFCRASMTPALQRHAAFNAISSAEAASRMGKIRSRSNCMVPSPQVPETTRAPRRSSRLFSAGVRTTCAVSDTEWSHFRMTRRCSRAVDQPDQFAVRIRVMRRQVLARKDAGEHVALFFSAHEKQRLPSLRPAGKRQRDARHVRLTASLLHAHDPTFLFLQCRAVREQRCGMSVRSNTPEHDFKQRPRRVEPVATIKSLELGLVTMRCDLGAALRCRHPMHG